jgi:hypothetical protein
MHLPSRPPARETTLTPPRHECASGGRPIAAQIIRSGAGNDATLVTQIADHIGGYVRGRYLFAGHALRSALSRRCRCMNLSMRRRCFV